MATQAYLARFYLAAQSLTAPSVASTAGYYFMEGYSGESTNQLIEHFLDLIDATYTGATVTLSKATGKVSISLGETGTITWGSATDLRDALGFTGSGFSQTDVETDTGANPARYVWCPLRNSAVAAASNYPNALTAVEAWNQPSASRVVRASDGTAYSIKAPLTTGEAEIAYRLLDKTSVRVSDDPDNGTFEQLWLDSIAKGHRMRVVLDVGANPAQAYSSANYVEALVGEDGALGSFGDYATRSVAGYDSLWDVSIPLVEFNP